MAASRYVRYGAAGAIGAALLVFSVVGQQGLRYVTTGSPGFVFGKGTPASPLDVKLSVDGTTITGTGSSGSAVSASSAISVLDFGLFGSGSDGGSSPCGTISIDTSLSRTIYCTSLTVNSGVTLNPNGWRIYVNGTLQLDGKIARNGGNASGATAGGGTTGNEICGSGAGGAGGAGGGGNGNAVGNCQGNAATYLDECSNSGGTGGAINGGNGAPGVACKGGGGGGGTTNGGAAAGTVSPASLSGGSFRAPYSAMLTNVGSGRGGAQALYGGGTGGGGGSTQSGGGGGGGGVILVVAKKVLGSGTVEAKGGNGAASPSCGGGNRCGGGGGGGGGNIFLIIGTGSFPTLIVTGGNGGSGTGGGGNGGTGGVGKTVTMKAGI